MTKNIVHVVRQFYPSVGGIEDYVYQLAKRQVKKGYSVKVITVNTNFQNGKSLPEKEVINDILVERINWFGSKRYPVAFSIIKHISRKDILHVHAVDFFCDYLSLLKRFGFIGNQLILTTHGGFFHTNKNKNIKKIFFNFITRFNLKKYSDVIACSVNDYDIFVKIFKSTRLIENGVEYRKFGSCNVKYERGKLLYFGRLSSNKNIEALIYSFQYLHRCYPEVKLFIIGRSDTGDVDKLKTIVKNNSLENKIYILLDMKDKDILNNISTSEYIVSSSLYEGFGLSVIEMMSYGLIPLLSDIKSFKKFVKESGVGAVYSSEDPMGLLESYKSSRVHESLCDRNAAMEYARKFSWDNVENSISELYE